MSRVSDRVWFIHREDGLGGVGEVAERELATAIREAGGEVGDREQAGRWISLDLSANELAAEGYRIVSRTEGERLTLSCAGRDKRGLIYAAYDLAERIRHGEPLEGLDVSEEPYCNMRRIYCNTSDHEAFEKVIQAMPRWRMNAFCLYGACHVPVERPGEMTYTYSHYLSLPIPYRKYPQVNAAIEESSYFQRARDAFTKLLAVARDHQIDVSVQFPILNCIPMDDDGPHYGITNMPELFPQLFLEGQNSPDWDSDALWQYVRDQLEELFETYPDLAGINLHSDEMSPYNLGHVMSSGRLGERERWVGRMVEEVEGICAKYGKHCYWNLHGCGDLYVDTLVEIGKSRPGGLKLCCECTRVELILSDRYAGYPFEKVVAAGDGMADHDIISQYVQGYPWLPNIFDNYVVRHLRAEREAGLRGGGALWWEDEPFYTPLNSLSGATMELLSRLLWDPDEPLDDIWERWLRRRFGERAAPAAGHLLRSTSDVLNGIFYFNKTNAMFWFDGGYVSMWFYMLNMDKLMGVGSWAQMVEYFQPAGTPLYDNPFNAVCKERAIPMSQMRGEKQAAIDQSKHLLDYLIEHQADFEEADYYHLLPRYLALHYYARAAYHLVEAVYNFTNLHIRHYDAECVEPRARMEEELEKLEELYLEMLADSRLRYLEPDVYAHGLRLHFMDHVHPVVKGMRFHDQVLSAPKVVDALPEEKRESARRILGNRETIREKFERNARGEVDAEKEWARVLGDLDEDD